MTVYFCQSIQIEENELLASSYVMLGACSRTKEAGLWSEEALWSLYMLILWPWPLHSFTFPVVAKDVLDFSGTMQVLTVPNK